MNIRMSSLVPALLAVVLSAAAGLAGSASAQDRAVADVAIDVMPELEERLDAGFIEGARAYVGANPQDGSASALAMIMTLRSHFVEAAWLYAWQGSTHPQDTAAWNNLALLLDEIHHGVDDAESRWLDDAVTLLQAAHASAPGNAMVQTNLGYALLERWRTGSDPEHLAEAAELLRGAIDADPALPFPRAHLAEVLLAQGDVDAARQAFDEAHRMASTSAVVMAAAFNNPQLTGSGGSPMPHCEAVDVVALCEQMCPCDSLVGCLNLVTCSIANSGYQSECRNGGPIPVSFNCATELPEFGIILPGLQSGFSIIGPGFKFHVGWDGKGGYKWEFEAGRPTADFASPYIKLSGHADPHTGEITGFDADAGIKFTIGPRSGDLGQLTAQHGIHPGGVSFETSQDKPVTVDAWEDLEGFFLVH